MSQAKVHFPQEVILEVTNRCNLRCRHCHFHGAGAGSRRSLGFMERYVWEKVLDEIASRAGSVTLLNHGAGEPLLYPELKALLQAARRIPGLIVGFMTNGMLLSRDWARFLVDLPLDRLALSIDGVVPETHDFFRQNASLRVIEENVMGLVAEKARQGSRLPLLSFNMVGYPAILAQVDEYIARWLPHGETVTISTFRPIGSRRLWQGPAPVPFRPCPLLYHQMVVSWDGKAGLCCEDINLDVPLGDVRNNSLQEIYNNSTPLQAYRRDHENGKIKALALCRDCHVWGGISLSAKGSTSWQEWP